MKSLEARKAARKARRNEAGHEYDPGVTKTAELQGNGAGSEPPAGGSGLEDKTVAQLRAHAEENGIDLGDATKKADIIAAIELAGEK